MLILFLQKVFMIKNFQMQNVIFYLLLKYSYLSACANIIILCLPLLFIVYPSTSYKYKMKQNHYFPKRLRYIQGNIYIFNFEFLFSILCINVSFHQKDESIRERKHEAKKKSPCVTLIKFLWCIYSSQKVFLISQSSI